MSETPQIDIKLLCAAFQLGEAMATVLWKLLTSPIVTLADAAEATQTEPASARVTISHLRRRMKPFDIPIQCSRGVGYSIRPDDRRRLEAMYCDFTHNLAG